MSEFFLELFSEEIPSNLQSNARKELKEIFLRFIHENEIIIKGEVKSLSTPNRLVIHIDKISKEIKKKSLEIRGPSTNVQEKALLGFLKSNNLDKNQIFKKTNEKGEFFFFKKPSQKISTFELFRDNVKSLLVKIPWKKSMRWGDHHLYWGRPLKSILAVFDKKVLDFIKSNEYLDMPDLINDLIKKKKSISFYINDKEWVDIGNNNNLSEARSRF